MSLDDLDERDVYRVRETTKEEISILWSTSIGEWLLTHLFSDFEGEVVGDIEQRAFSTVGRLWFDLTDNERKILTEKYEKLKGDKIPDEHYR